MNINLEINTVDAIILLIVLVLFILGIRVVIGFFKKDNKDNK